MLQDPGKEVIRIRIEPSWDGGYGQIVACNCVPMVIRILLVPSVLDPREQGHNPQVPTCQSVARRIGTLVVAFLRDHRLDEGCFVFIGPTHVQLTIALLDRRVNCVGR